MAQRIFATMNAPRPVILTGMPGGGKSAAGFALSRLLRCDFIETDAAAEAAAGMPVADIFAKHGEAHFRDLESAALQSAMQKNAVISTGGGVVLQDKNRKMIRGGGRAVYLQASLQLLTRRLQKDATTRPLLAGKDIADSLAELLAHRESLYRQTAHLTVMQHEDDTPADVAAKVCAGLRHLE